MNDLEFLRSTLKDAAIAAGATVIQDSFYQFAPYGISGVVIIAESHLSVHTWPEFNYAAVDIFTCGMTTRPEAASELIVQRLESKEFELHEVKRGLMPEVPAEYPKQKAGIRA
ncbi:MAG: adenosylmethionine decarboxylase [Dehalococcoidia bacterium]|nr:adenosylmethionine decarboxylase [Dehalococcoidia bacterium]